jgi:hypothetical protein
MTRQLLRYMPVFPAGNNQLKFTKKNLLNGLKILARHKLIEPMVSNLLLLNETFIISGGCKTIDTAKKVFVSNVSEL